MSCGAAAPLMQNIPVIIRRNTTGRVQVELVDEHGCPVDASELELIVLYDGESIQYRENFFTVFVAPTVHRIIKPSGTTGRYYIEWGDIFLPATINATTGTYPTGFTGGETLQIQIDEFARVITFQAGDQTITDVVNRINATFGTLLGQYAAFDNSGQLQLKGKRLGTYGMIVINGATSPAVLTALGLVVGTTLGTTRQDESSSSGSKLFVWRAADVLHPSEATEIVQVVQVCPSALFQMLPHMRFVIDKAAKMVNPSQGQNLGYTDAQLIQCLIGGVQTINTYQPAVYFDLDTFPYSNMGSILLDAAMVWGITAQMLFAVDSDVPSFSSQGESFQINHQSPLANYLNGLTARLDRMVPQFKLHYVQSGTVVTQIGPSYRLNQLLAAAPSGATFRNLFTRE